MMAAKMRWLAAGVNWPFRFPMKEKAPLTDCQKPIGFAMAWMAPSVETSICALPMSSTCAVLGAAAKNCENRDSWVSLSGTLRGSVNRGFVDVKR